MTEIYRFRSVNALLDEWRELDTQTIYFAEPIELNDPFEHVRNIVWQGDAILWNNFFRHYISCVYTITMHFYSAGDDWAVNPMHIPIRGITVQTYTITAQNTFDQICEMVFERCGFTAFIEKLVGMSVSRSEIKLYLEVLHKSVVKYIHHVMVENDSIEVDLNVRHIIENKDADPQMATYVRRTSNDNEDDDSLTAMLRKYVSMIPELLAANTCYDNQSTDVRKTVLNRQFLMLEMPSVYLDRVSALVWPRWYTACFTKNCENSALWAHYGDSHRGVALIFDTDENDGVTGLELNTSIEGNEYDDGQGLFIETDDITYTDENAEVNFFEAIGWLPQDELLRTWYVGHDAIGLGIIDRVDDPAWEILWMEKYKYAFHKSLTTKMKAWSYEEEVRLVFVDKSDFMLNSGSQKLRYRFENLTGIVFGLRTPQRQKLELAEVIGRMCRRNDRGSFDFYESVDLDNNGRILKMPIPNLANLIDFVD